MTRNTISIQELSLSCISPFFGVGLLSLLAEDISSLRAVKLFLCFLEGLILYLAFLWKAAGNQLHAKSDMSIEIMIELLLLHETASRPQQV